MLSRNLIGVLHLLMCFLEILSNNRTQAIVGRCSMQCTTPKLLGGEIYSKCNMTEPLKLNCSSEEFDFLQLRNVSFLDLSHSSLSQVPRRLFPYCESLKTLTLAGNNLTNIEPGTFQDLRSLRTLNLSFNNLQKWKVNLNTELQSLSNIDVTGNKAWLPSKQLLQLKNLTTVRGVTWSKYCKICLLTRSPVNEIELNSSCSRYSEISSPSGWPWHEQIQYGRALDFIKVGFWPTCLCDDVCYLHQFRLPNRRAFYHVSNKAALSLFFFGSLAILANVIVVLVILLSRSLRGDTAAILMCNVALCDVFMGVFSITYAFFHNSKLLTEQLEELVARQTDNSCDYHCKIQRIRNIAGPILMTAMMSQVCGSFVMVVEKFLKIVFPVKPDIWFERRDALIALIISWSVAFAYSILPVFGVAGLVYKDYIPSDPHRIVIVTFILLALIQCSSLALHFPMLIVARRSATNAGIKRETAIAKKIALLVFTNLVFFTCPVVLGLVWSVRYQNFPKTTLTEAQWLVFTFTGIPFLCMSTNSALNPFLYALRHPKIKRELKMLFTRCRTVCDELFAAVIQHLRCNTIVVHGENNIELGDEQSRSKLSSLS